MPVMPDSLVADRVYAYRAPALCLLLYPLDWVFLIKVYRLGPCLGGLVEPRRPVVDNKRPGSPAQKRAYCRKIPNRAGAKNGHIVAGLDVCHIRPEIARAEHVCQKERLLFFKVVRDLERDGVCVRNSDILCLPAVVASHILAVAKYCANLAIWV